MAVNVLIFKGILGRILVSLSAYDLVEVKPLSSR